MAIDWISFTTDYGIDDGFVAACAGVIGRIAPGVRVIDVTHTVPPQDVRRGAVVLARTVPYLPPAVHLAVVDPGVGTARRGLVVVAAGGLLVGPDNGLLLPAAEALGGVVGAFELADSGYRLPVVAPTFHGRDVFAPAAAHLASGVPAQRLGPPVDPATLVRLAAPAARLTGGGLETEVLAVDRFGNVQLAAGAADLAALELRPGGPVRLRLGRRSVPATLASTFADVAEGGLLVHVDSAGLVELAVNHGSASGLLGIGPGDPVRLGRAE